MFKKIFITINLLILANLILALPSAAHLLRTDGTYGAVMHIEPDDDPIANSPATFYFDFKDKAGIVNPDNCRCKVFIYQINGDAKSVLFNTDLFGSNTKPGIDNPSFSYTFPSKGVYEIDIEGSPKLNDNKFKIFKIEYDIRVERENKQNNSTFTNSKVKNVVKYSIPGVIILIILILLVNKFLLKKVKKL